MLFLLYIFEISAKKRSSLKMVFRQQTILGVKLSYIGYVKRVFIVPKSKDKGVGRQKE